MLHQHLAPAIPHRIRPWQGYGIAVLACLVAVAGRWALLPLLGAEAPLLLFILPVLVSSIYGGLRPGLLATTLSTLIGTYFFIPPFGSFIPDTLANLTRVSIFLIEGTLISGMSAALRRAYEQAAHRAHELAASEERQARIVETIVDGIVIVDTDGLITFANQAAERLLRLTRSAIATRRYDDPAWRVTSLDGSPFPNDQLPVAQVLRTAAPVSHVEHAVVYPDGTRVMLAVSAAPLRERDGTLVGVVASFRDISARKQAELGLKRAAAELEERVAARTAQLAEANAELEAFAYIAAHDLRAPLRGLQGIATAVIEDYGDTLDDTGRHYLRRIEITAAQMDTLIADLLEYSRLSRAELQLEVVSLQQAVDEALAQLMPRIAERNANVVVAEALPAVIAHQPTLVQVLANLLNNAITFLAPGVQAQVALWAERRAQSGRALVRLWVVDNGIGIAPDQQQRIFLVFERLHGQESYPGTGVGLAIVRRGVERMGGAAGVESAQGQGSKFWVELPAWDSANASGEPVL